MLTILLRLKFLLITPAEGDDFLISAINDMPLSSNKVFLKSRPNHFCSLRFFLIAANGTIFFISSNSFCFWIIILSKMLGTLDLFKNFNLFLMAAGVALLSPKKLLFSITKEAMTIPIFANSIKLFISRFIFL